MFKKKSIELSRSEMIAVRLVDAINLEGSEKIESFRPIWGGFKLEITKEVVGTLSYRKLSIMPAGWPKGSIISCLLVAKDGVVAFDNGQITTPHLGNFTFTGCDLGGGSDQVPRPTMAVARMRPAPR